jgi:hypothetical protein
MKDAGMDDLANLRRQLRAGGYHPIPCVGKAPPMKGWSDKLNVTDDEIGLWTNMYHFATNTGLICKFTPTMDIDILNPEAAKAAESIVRDYYEERGDILVRFGLSPKRAIPFRTDTPFKIIKVPLIAPDGSEGQKIELLADGQQFIAFGIHPDTRKPYGWFGNTPLQTPHQNLPHIHEQGAATLVNTIVDLLVSEHQYSRVPERPKEKPNGQNGGTADWNYLIEAIRAGRDLHQNTMLLAAKLIASGMNEGAVRNVVRSALEGSQAPHDDRWHARYDDVPRLVAGIVAKRHAAQQPPPAFQLIRFRDLRPGLTRNYLVKGVIPRVGIVIVWGPPKCGKSFWTFDLVMHVALGWPYRTRNVVSGAVVYCAFEGADGFKDRAEAFRRHHELDPGKDIPFFLLPSHAKLVRDQQALIAAIRAASVAPVVVVLDTLNRSLDGSESKDEDMGAYLSAAEAIQAAFGCVVIIVHHCGVEGTRPRGHSSLTGTADAQLAVKRDDDENVLVRLEYMKDGPEGAELASRLDAVEVGTDEDGDPRTSCVVVATTSTSGTAKEPKLPAAPKLALDKLKELVVTDGETAPASNYVPSGVKVVSVTLWREIFYKSYVADKPDAKQKAFVRATLKLQEAHLVGIWSDMAWLAGHAGH